MRIRLDPEAPNPVSTQLAAAIEGRIQGGTLAPGSRLPTVRKLASDLELAANTVAKAYRELEAAGLLVGRGRLGTFVVDRLPEQTPERERRLAEAANAYVRRAVQLGFTVAQARGAVEHALRER
ncbi:MAG: GntR family transcriptional regulator [Actinobacteria bacterium]|nr:GntR family transcriptional regulator [Actinomycetota bacterium]